MAHIEVCQSPLRSSTGASLPEFLKHQSTSVGGGGLQNIVIYCFYYHYNHEHHFSKALVRVLMWPRLASGYEEIGTVGKQFAIMRGPRSRSFWETFLARVLPFISAWYARLEPVEPTLGDDGSMKKRFYNLQERKRNKCFHHSPESSVWIVAMLLSTCNCWGDVYKSEEHFLESLFLCPSEEPKYKGKSHVRFSQFLSPQLIRNWRRKHDGNAEHIALGDAVYQSWLVWITNRMESFTNVWLHLNKPEFMAKWLTWKLKLTHALV